MTILEAVGDYLQTNSHGTLGSSLFLAVMPDTPDACVCVYEKPGMTPQMTMGSAPWIIDQPGIQIICRAGRGDYPTARDKADAIRLLLSAVTNTTISGINVMRIEAEGAVLPMGEDSLGRPLVSVNFACKVRA